MFGGRLRFSSVIIFTLGLFLAAAHAQEPEFAPYVELAKKGQHEKAYKGLLDQPDSRFSYEKLHLKYLALGQWASDLKKWPEARAHLERALKFGLQNASNIYYLIGHTYKEEGDFQKASDAFNRALDHNPAQNIIYQTRFEFSEMALKSGKPARAREHLQYLERRWRQTPNYADIVFRLMGVEFKENRRHMACRWARKLYSRYPTHPLVSDWEVDLPSNRFEGQTIGCLASNKEISERLRRLQLSGRADKARTEIDKLRTQARPQEVSEVDMMLVRFLEFQGFPDEALQILIRYYEARRGDVNYQNLLAKVAARAGEFQAAVGAYYNAYRLSPRSKLGKTALFTSAFLSYQIQDYDGATRKFTDVARKFSGSGLARDAKWHLSWLQYLRGDYSGAEKSLRALLNEKYYTRRRRAVRPFANDRTKYWLAMSLVRQEKYPEARTLLSSLAQDKSLGYYSLVAQQRMAQLPVPAPERTLASATTATNDAAGGAADEPSEVVTAASPMLLFSPNGEREAVNEENESEESIQATIEANGDDNDGASDVDADPAPTGPQLEAAGEETDRISAAPETISVTAFRDPRLRERFQRAHNLMALGMYDWAKWELFEIERRTSNRAYLRSLMEAYTKIGFYNRASYISEIYFGSERARLGFKEGQDLWSYNFPQAYRDSMERYAKQFGVPEALVWGIMRAESQFNFEAISPVGARGLMQIMPYTADQLTRLLGEPRLSEKDLLNPDVNIRLGARYLSRLQKKFQEQIPFVAAGYNAGPHRVYSWLNTFGTLDMDEFIEHVPFVETRNYIKKVVRNYAVYNQLYGSKDNKDTFVWLAKPVPMRVSARPSPRENWEMLD
jgi:soluble lytic murein transglycosylase